MGLTRVARLSLADTSLTNDQIIALLVRMNNNGIKRQSMTTISDESKQEQQQQQQQQLQQQQQQQQQKLNDAIEPLKKQSGTSPTTTAGRSSTAKNILRVVVGGVLI